MTVNGANSNPTWKQVVNVLVSDATDPTKLRNIKELTGEERNIILKALQSNDASKISPEQLKIFYGKLTTNNFKRTTNVVFKILRGFRNLIGVRMSSDKFREEVLKSQKVAKPLSKEAIDEVTGYLTKNVMSEEVLKSQRVVEPLSKEAIDGVTGYLTKNVMSEDKDGNLHSLRWENIAEGMKAELPVNHEEIHIDPSVNKMEGKETQVEGGSRFVTVSKYAALQEKFDFGKWLAKNKDIGAALNPAVNFLKTAFKKAFDEVEFWELERDIGKVKIFDFSQVKKQEVQEYLQATFPDFDDYKLIGEGTVTLELNDSALVIFKEFQMPEGRGMEFIKKE